jgi:hypothetical protein
LITDTSCELLILKIIPAALLNWFYVKEVTMKYIGRYSAGSTTYRVKSEFSAKWEPNVKLTDIRTCETRIQIQGRGVKTLYELKKFIARAD